LDAELADLLDKNEPAAMEDDSKPQLGQVIVVSDGEKDDDEKKEEEEEVEVDDPFDDDEDWAIPPSGVATGKGKFIFPPPSPLVAPLLASPPPSPSSSAATNGNNTNSSSNTTLPSQSSLPSLSGSNNANGNSNNNNNAPAVGGIRLPGPSRRPPNYWRTQSSWDHQIVDRVLELLKGCYPGSQPIPTDEFAIVTVGEYCGLLVRIKNIVINPIFPDFVPDKMTGYRPIVPGVVQTRYIPPIHLAVRTSAEPSADLQIRLPELKALASRIRGKNCTVVLVELLAGLK
jgi:hypothetical protein